MAPSGTSRSSARRFNAPKASPCIRRNPAGFGNRLEHSDGLRPPRKVTRDATRNWRRDAIFEPRYLLCKRGSQGIYLNDERRAARQRDTGRAPLRVLRRETNRLGSGLEARMPAHEITAQLLI